MHFVFFVIFICWSFSQHLICVELSWLFDTPFKNGGLYKWEETIRLYRVAKQADFNGVDLPIYMYRGIACNETEEAINVSSLICVRTRARIGDVL